MGDDFKTQLITANPFSHESEDFQRYIAEVELLLKLGANQTDDLIALLNSDTMDGEVIRIIVCFLRYLNYKPAVTVLKRLAQDPTIELDARYSTIISLSDLGRSKVYRTIRKFALTDPEPKLRIAAVVAFIWSSSKRGFNTIIEVIKSDSDPSVRGAAIRVIGSMRKIDREVAFDLMLIKLQDTSEDVVVRAYAVEGLGFLMDTRAISLVINYLQHEAPEIRYMAAYALGCLGDLSHLPLLQAMLNDDAVFEGWGTVANGAIEGIDQLNSRIACAFESGVVGESINEYAGLARKDLLSL